MNEKTQDALGKFLEAENKAKGNAVSSSDFSEGLEAIAFLLTLMPEWVVGMEKGLPETFYGAESAKEGKRICDKVAAIRRMVERESH